MIPTSFDELICIGGAKLKTAERRAWDAATNDYVFKPATIPGQELIENPAEYDSALPTFTLQADQESAFPQVEKDSKIIFGNEIDCFIIEFPKTLQPKFFYSPMILQQKTGQESLRYDQNTIFMIGGTDFTRTKISSKFYKFNLQNNQVQEFDKLTTPRYFPSFLSVNKVLYVIGGLGDKATPLASCERISADVSDASLKWTDLPPMSAPRFGHVAWSDALKIVVMGGKSGDKSPNHDSIEIFDTAANNWSVHRTLCSPSCQDESSALQAGRLRTPRSHLPRRWTRRQRKAICRSLQVPQERSSQNGESFRPQASQSRSLRIRHR